MRLGPTMFNSAWATSLTILSSTVFAGPPAIIVDGLWAIPPVNCQLTDSCTFFADQPNIYRTDPVNYARPINSNYPGDGITCNFVPPNIKPVDWHGEPDVNPSIIRRIVATADAEYLYIVIEGRVERSNELILLIDSDRGVPNSGWAGTHPDYGFPEAATLQALGDFGNGFYDTTISIGTPNATSFSEVYPSFMSYSASGAVSEGAPGFAVPLGAEGAQATIRGVTARIYIARANQGVGSGMEIALPRAWLGAGATRPTAVGSYGIACLVSTVTFVSSGAFLPGCLPGPACEPTGLPAFSPFNSFAERDIPTFPWNQGFGDPSPTPTPTPTPSPTPTPPPRSGDAWIVR